MAGLVARPAFRPPPYSGTAAGRHRRRIPALAAVFSLGLMSGGCAMSQQLGSLFGPKEDKDSYAQADDVVTGSIGARTPSQSRPQPQTGLPPEVDLAYA